jgi:hypothetical protein
MAGTPRFDARERASLSWRLWAGGITVTGLYQVNAVTVMMKIIQPILYILLILSDFAIREQTADERR